MDTTLQGSEPGIMKAPRRSASRQFLVQWAIYGLALGMLGAFIAWSLVQEHRRIDAEERDRLANQTAVIEKNLKPQLLLANRVIEDILDNLPAWQAANDGFRRGNRELQVINDTLIGIRPILVIRADGVVSASSNEKLIGMNFAYREYFKTAQRNPDPAILHITAPFKTVLDTYVISIFRTIRAPDGGFGGIVIVSVVPEYFSILLESVRYAPDMTTSLAHGDGQLFLTSPIQPGANGKDLARPGTFFTRHRESGNAVDLYDGNVYATGAHRLIGLRTLRLVDPPVDKPMVISASRDADALFAPWYRGLFMQASLFGVMSIVSAAGLWLLQRRYRDQFKERRSADRQIRKLAFFDQLTSLPNRILLMDRLRQCATSSDRSGSHGAILFIDLDNFKVLNDTLGHDMGDLLLKLVGERLGACLRAVDTVARLGGDEFVVMLTELSADEREAAVQVQAVGSKLVAALSQPYELNGVPYRSTSSIGATLFKGTGTPTDDLLKQADLAMYKAKADGRNAFRFFDPSMLAVMMERTALESDLREAVRGGHLLLHYQAQVVGDGRITGVEALARWPHPRRGMVSPAQFIPLAEETGLILPLGQWVLRTACSQLAAWADRPETAHLTIAVNVSAHQFGQPDFVDQVLATLRETGASPHRLKLELTESLLVANVGQLIEKMSALKAQGVGFSLDDFGTGYSSLAYLKRLPLDQLKIDQSFVRDVLTDPNDASIARTIIALAQSLNLGVIAEGVETAAQRDFLAASGCHSYQGYFFSRPLPLKDFERLLPESVPVA
jgi:diguanylate cyclase (GGDEF)-like protein